MSIHIPSQEREAMRTEDGTALRRRGGEAMSLVTEV
jgi:hypothetical protein